jgi:glycosyltransferase involved in cell wall biosynthesis
VKTSNIELHILRKRIDQKEAPFTFQEDYSGIFLYDRELYTYSEISEKVKSINPVMIICSGWHDTDYLKVVSSFTGKIPTIMSLDNQWNGTVKQKLFSFLSPFIIKTKFSHVWVAGEPQVIYAKKLGFKEEQISQGFYVANSENFSLETINPKHIMKKKFIFVGRYVDVKGIKDLWQAFIELHNEYPNNWELICIGTGPLCEEKIENTMIKHVGFVQPKDLKNYMADGGVFVLPSHFEPWGVVVHEFALAGFPLIVSNTVGAGTQFVRDGENGFIFQAKNITALKENLLKFIKMSDINLLKMSNKSIELGHRFTEDMWVDTVNKILLDYRGK